MMTLKTKLAVALTVFFWASAFVGIRMGLQDYSPEGLALLRYLIASTCMGLIYYFVPNKSAMLWFDRIALLGVGALGIGIYNLTLNYGELEVSSGMASFIISQAPVVTAVLAFLFLGERLTLARAIGFMISIFGMGLISLGEKGTMHLDASLIYILIATLAGSLYSILQKSFLKKYHAIQTTTYVIWGGTLFLLMYFPHLKQDVSHATFKTTLTIVYLGIFPATLAYVAWSYVLKEIPVARAVSFLYFMPFLATLLGWVYLNEIPMWLSLVGGVLAIIGVWLVNRSYRFPLKNA